MKRRSWLLLLVLLALPLVLGGCFSGKPVAYISATPMSGYAPLTVQFSASPNGCASYQWTFGDGTSGSGQYPVHTYAKPGTYVATLVVSKQDMFCGTTQSDPVSVTIRVMAKPVLKIKSIGVKPLPACANTPIVLTADVEHNYRIVSWQWSSSDGHSSSAASSTTFTFGTPGTKTVTLTVTDELGGTAIASTTFKVDDCCAPCLSECISLSPWNLTVDRCELVTIKVNFEDCPCHGCAIETETVLGTQGIVPVPCPGYPCCGDWYIKWTVEKYEMVGCCEEAYVPADPDYYDSWSDGPNRQRLNIKFFRSGNYRVVADLYINGKYVSSADGYYSVRN